MKKESSKSTKMRLTTESPEHNRMQGDFLDDDFCLKFYEIAMPFEFSDRKERGYSTMIGKRQVQVDLINPTGEKYIWDKNFEKKGIDISFCIGIDFEQIKDSWDTETLQTYGNRDELELTYYTKNLNIEIVPEVSDDYPNLLNQMQKLDSNCLYLNSYTGQGIDEEKFVMMFKQQGIIVVFERQLKEIKK